MRYNTLLAELYYNRQFWSFVDYIKKGVDNMLPLWYALDSQRETTPDGITRGADTQGGLHYV